jgi:Ca2+/H+ antiporter, TMEM165/GDT1 family
MKRGKGFLIVVCVLGVGALLSFIVMSLWNMILPAAITGVNPINFWQALGLLILSKILFGGFNGGWKHKKEQWMHKKEQWKNKMNAKLENMSPEEREQFKQELRNRCRAPWSRSNESLKNDL